MRSLALILALIPSLVFAQTSGVTPFGGSLAPPGTNGQTAYNNNGSFGAYSLIGDCSYPVTVGVSVCGNPYLETQTFIASAGANPSIIIPQGTTPSGTPPNGSIWNTSAGMFVQIAGATVGPLGVAGGGSACPTATPCTTQQTINDATANRYGLILGPATITSGTQGFGINVTGTINSGTVIDGAALFSNITCTSCGAGTNLIDLQVASVSQLKVSNTGTTTTGNLALATTGNISFNARGAFNSTQAATLANGNLSATPGQVNWVGQGGTGTNISGGATVYSGGQGTGTGVPGSACLGNSIVGTTGTTLQATFQCVLTVDSSQHATYQTITAPTCGTGCASINTGSSDGLMAVVSGSAVTAVTVNFGKAWTANNPVGCVAGTNLAVPLAVSITALSTTAVTVTSASAVTGATITIRCG